MKLRVQRTHLMGASNRNYDSFLVETKNANENIYIKSQSNYHKTAQSLPPCEAKESKTRNPFQGTHFEQDSLRWNSRSKKAGTQTEWNLKPVAQRIDYSGLLNQQVADLSSSFQGKDVNMFKLNELKRTFIKNNRKRRDLNAYFNNFADKGRVGIEEMKRIVREYGYDITDDEAKILFRLSGTKEESLAIDQFVELMTKENVHFKTLKIDGTFGRARKNFDEKIHLVLKNKFNLLKQAFRIYRMRGEEVNKEKYDYVMKKLDVNDLVVSREQREQLFQQFCEKSNSFNVQRLLCAIVEQQYTIKPSFPPKLSDFDDNLRAIEEQSAKKDKSNIYFDFKRMSHIQYESQLSKAQQVKSELNKISQSSELVSKYGGLLTRDQLRNKLELLLQKNGINFNKQDYECFTSYLDFNSNNQISSNDFKKFLQEPTKQAEQRFERRIRTLPPQRIQPGFCDEETALGSLTKVKNKKFETQMRVLFKEFDQDKDGYISRGEFKAKISRFSVLQNWEIENMANYFDPEGRGFVTFKDFARKYTAGDKEPNNLTESSMKPKSQSQWLSTKKSYIKDANNSTFNVPSKYSAWPERLKRTDFSMIQPPSLAGQFLSQQQRFNASEKHTFAQQMKHQKHRVYQHRLKKLVAWNELNQKRIQNNEQQSAHRNQANDYLLRLTKQSYEQHCHK